MSELDRRIAEEVMGEPKPEWHYPTTPTPVCIPEASTGGAWSRVSWNHDWKPLPFSSNLQYAMKAVDRYFAGTWHDARFDGSMDATYYGGSKSWAVNLDGAHGAGSTLPEAICKLLLALVEGK